MPPVQKPTGFTDAEKVKLLSMADTTNRIEEVLKYGSFDSPSGDRRSFTKPMSLLKETNDAAKALASNVSGMVQTADQHSSALAQVRQDHAMTSNACAISDTEGSAALSQHCVPAATQLTEKLGSVLQRLTSCGSSPLGADADADALGGNRTKKSAGGSAKKRKTAAVRSHLSHGRLNALWDVPPISSPHTLHPLCPSPIAQESRSSSPFPFDGDNVPTKEQAQIFYDAFKTHAVLVARQIIDPTMKRLLQEGAALPAPPCVTAPPPPRACCPHHHA
jgi:hypothetical protein